MSRKIIQKEKKMNKFAAWIKKHDKKQRGVAEKLSISTSTLHEILRKGLLPNLKLAYDIEIYTNGAVTLYDWIDQINEQIKPIKKEKSIQATKKSTKQ